MQHMSHKMSHACCVLEQVNKCLTSKIEGQEEEEEEEEEVNCSREKESQRQAESE